MSSVFLYNILVGAAVILAVSYFTTRRNFRQIHYMIQVFDDAEKGKYPSGIRRSMKDEYDLIMNNIIYVFLNTVQLKASLAERKMELERTEFGALQLQINPHFLYNTLQTVEFELQKAGEEQKNTRKILRSLSDILKYSLESPSRPVSVREEIAYLKKYVEIQRYRFGGRFIVYYEIDEAAYDAEIFRLLLQPLVENSLLHGIRGSAGTGYIKLKIFVRGGRIHIHVVDNGVGMTKEETEALYRKMEEKESRRIGLANVNSRLILRYGTESRLVIRAKPGSGCWMSFSIPYQENVNKEEKK